MIRPRDLPGVAGRALALLLPLASMVAPATLPSPVAALEPEQVLVIYNHPDPDSLAVRDAYVRARPGVLDFNLGDRALVGRPTISHGDFKERIRNPIRAFLASRPGLAQRVICLVTTKGVPHRIADHDRPDCGDDPEAMRREWLERGDFTAASVDSELTLLWQDLDRGEAGGSFDSAADGFVLNPYHRATRPIAEFDRTGLLKRKKLAESVPAETRGGLRQGGWTSARTGPSWSRLEPGDLHLVARLDGPTVATVRGMIERASSLEVDPARVAVLLDGGADRAKGAPRAGARSLDRGDYARAAALLENAGWFAMHDATPHFLACQEIGFPLIAYAGYGMNEPGASPPADYLACFRWAPGAVFNTLESFNGRDFGGLGDRPAAPQTQLADFLEAGGTFGVANVWEPYSFSAAENEALLGAFLVRGTTFVEAAWSSLRALSWQQIVVGDPLARVEVVRCEADDRAPEAPAPGSLDPAPPPSPILSGRVRLP